MRPENFDFASNLNTLWAVVIGAILATLGGFIATQMEWFLEHRRRQKQAALFFGEVLSTIFILLDFARSTKGRGDPYGPITTRMLRQARAEIELYNRNRETLYGIQNSDLRARIHTLVLRINGPVEGIFDATEEIRLAQLQLKSGPVSEEDRQELEARIARLSEVRESGFEFAMQTADQIKPLVADLEPLAGHTFERMHEIANS